jgi:adenylate cyclase
MDLPLDVRVGIHVGPVVAGVIGAKRPAFDCWGQSVNLASRLESAADPGSILLSEQAWHMLRDTYPDMTPQAVDLKGIGRARAFALKVADEPVPDANDRFALSGAETG